MSDQFILDIEKMAYGGDALGFHERSAVFVPLAVPGDKISASWISKKPGHGKARLIAIEKASPNRVSAPCLLFGSKDGDLGCGGCQWQMMSYDFQLKAKNEILLESLARIGRFKTSKLNIESCRGMSDPWRFRNKVQYPLSRGSDGKLKLGYYQRGTHQIKDLKSCPVELDMFDRALPAVRELLEEPRYLIYDEKTNRGLLRHLCLRGSARTKEMLMVLVLREAPSAHWVQDFVKLGLSGLQGIVANINGVSTNVIFGQETMVLWGKPFYREQVLGKIFQISSGSFFQTNVDQAEKMVEDLMEYLPKRMSTVVDAYSGVGLFSLFLAERSKQVIAIEENFSARADALVNAKSNGFKGIDWICAKTEKTLKKIGSQLDLVVLDPPRQGVEMQALATLNRRPPKQLVYISCDPATLARDLRVLVDGEFEIERIVPFDLFPHTYHLETIVYLRRKNREKR